MKHLTELYEQALKDYDEQLAIIDKLKDEFTKDKMEQLDDYVIYLIEKYEKILKGETDD